MSRKDTDFFQSIRRSVKLSYIISSLLPLLILIYVLHQFVFPKVGYEVAQDIQIYLILVVIISVLGLFFLLRETNKSISSAETLQSKLNSLIGITKQFRETLYVDILLESIVKSAMHLNSAESGSLLLYDDAGDLRFKVLVGDLGQKIKDHAVKRGEGITGWVAEKGEAAIINDTSKDKRFNAQFDKESGYRTRSIMCVPLVHSNEVIGVIEVLNKRNGSFSEEDQRLLYSLADQASISIAQSRSFESRHSDLIHITELLVSAQDFHTPEKRGHARRTASYANMIAKEVGLSEGELKVLYYAGLFHDIGLLKVSVHERTQKEKIK
ncbi:MAG TPA: GAF domain-containing protein, partial [Nitrospirae bacterium]|nr:GAF domain-containing protein [Nitrospirota bacterium]